MPSITQDGLDQACVSCYFLKMKCVAVIPARYGSTRLPGKPLLMLGNKPIIQHVYERASALSGMAAVWVATDDERIYACVEAFGGKARMTSLEHQSGSDRIAEVVRDENCDWVLNIQGDEPFVEQTTLQGLLDKALQDGGRPVYTPAAPIRSLEEWMNPSIVKVVVARNGEALYFSRWPLPFVRQSRINSIEQDLAEAGGRALQLFPFRRHLGIYLYRRDFLMQFVAWPPGELEKAEQLEQLRILENGFRIGVLDVERAILSIDTLEDYQQACRLCDERLAAGNSVG
jgi:3-deoxy-manno-octulosonate cytidylyltransferase (CMP-KDO synthetase)